MDKTSLLGRALYYAGTLGFVSVYTDFQLEQTSCP
jgi:hypothetical protein